MEKKPIYTMVIPDMSKVPIGSSVEGLEQMSMMDRMVRNDALIDFLQCERKAEVADLKRRVI